MPIRKRGKGYQVDVRIDVGGNCKRRVRKQFDRYKKAKAYEVELLHKSRRGELDVVGEKMTVAELAETYVANHFREVSEGTQRLYTGLLNNHLIPRLGHIRIRAVRLEDVEELRNDMEEDKIGPRAIGKAIVLLGGLFRFAIRHRWCTYNPAERFKKPRVQSRKPTVLAPEQIDVLLAHADELWCLIIETALLSGLRQAELIALRWSDVDFDAGQLVVEQQWKHGKFRRLKTASSERRVIVSGELLAKLRRWRIGCPVSRHDLVFGDVSGEPIEPTKLLRALRAVVRRAGLPRMTFHDLRHTYGSLLVESGESLKVVQKQMGHSNLQTTLRHYIHLIPGSDAGVGERLDAFVRGRSRGGHKRSQRGPTTRAGASRISDLSTRRGGRVVECGGLENR